MIGSAPPVRRRVGTRPRSPRRGRKFFPASDVLLLHELGVRAIGENKDQKAGPKIAAVRTALAGTPISSCTSSGACSPTRLATSPATPTSSTPSTGSSCSAGCRRVRWSRTDRCRCSSRSASTATPVAERGRSQRDDAGSPAPSPTGSGSRPQSHGDRFVEADPDASFAHLREVASGTLSPASRRRLGVRGNEWGPRGGPARSSTPACRNRDPRLTPVTSVTSKRAWGLGVGAMAGHCQDDELYLGLGEEDPRHDRYDDYDDQANFDTDSDHRGGDPATGKPTPWPRS